MKFYRVERSKNSINSFCGESGNGIYATPSKKVLHYYKLNTFGFFRVLIFTPKNNQEIINLHLKRKELISFIEEELNRLAKDNPGYIKPKINQSNYHRFPWAIMNFINLYYPDCSGYIIAHTGGGLQIVIKKLERFDIKV